MAKGDDPKSPKSPKSPKEDSKGSKAGDSKGDPKGKPNGIVNVKGTPSPPRYKAGEEQPPLPSYPITWTTAAVCVESSGPALDLHTLVELCNQSSRPALSFAIVDAQELLDEELGDEESELGKALLEAKQESTSGFKKDKDAKDNKSKDGKEAKGKGKEKPPEKEKDKDKGKGKGKEKGQSQMGSWLQPAHLQQLLAARQIRDRDFEHREEVVRRADQVEEAKRKAEEAKKSVEDMQAGLEAAKKALQEFEERDRKRIREEWWAQKAAAAAAAKNPEGAKGDKKSDKGDKKGDKGDKKGEKAARGGKDKQGGDKGAQKPPTPPKGKDKGKDKGKGAPPPPVLTPAEERLSCQNVVKQRQEALEAAEAQVIETEKRVADLEAVINEPFATSRIYCCLGFGDNATSVAELAASQDNIFCAILNIAKKLPPPPQPDPPETVQSPDKDKDKGTKKDGKAETPLRSASPAGAAEKGNEKGGKKDGKAEAPSRPSSPAEKGKKSGKEKTEQPSEVLVPPLVAEMRALAKAADLRNPARKIFVMDVLYEDKKDDEVPPDDKAERPKTPGKKEKELGTKKEGGKGAEKRPGSPPGAKKGKGGKGEEDMQYAQIVEAVVKSCRALTDQVKEFRKMDGDTRFVEIPLAIPFEEVKMDHYKHLLDEVAPALVTVPVILHCMIEQVAVSDCEKTDIQTLEAMNQRKEARVLLEHAFLNLGRRLEIPYHSPFGNIFLPPEFDYDEMEDPAPCEPGCTCDLHPYTFDGIPVEPRKRSRYEEHLNVIQEQSSFGLLKAILTRKRRDPHKIKHEPQLSLSAPTVVDVLNVEQRMVKLLPTPGRGRRDFPNPPSYPLEKRGTCMTALRKFSRIFFPAAQRYRKLRHIADLLLNRKVETVPTGVDTVEAAALPGEQPEEGPVSPDGTTASKDGDKGQSLAVQEPPLTGVDNGRKSLSRTAGIREDSKRNSLFGDCTAASVDGTQKGSEKTPSTPGSDREEWHIRPSRFTQTAPLTVLPEELAPLESAFDQRNLRPHESVLNCRFVDTFPDDTFGEAYSKARLALPFERMLYDKDEDFVISVLFAEEGEHQWTGHVPSLIPFERFCSDLTACERRKADFAASQNTFCPPTVYGIEDTEGNLSEKKTVFLGQGESLVCNGLPMQTKPEAAVCYKPQATMYKDGATFLLRGENRSAEDSLPLDNNLTACLKDGLTICFYITKDGTPSMQITHPSGQTFELTSAGVVLCFPTNVKEKEKERAEEKAAQEAAEKALIEKQQADQAAVEADLKKGGKKGADPKKAGKGEAKVEAKARGDAKEAKGEAKGKDAKPEKKGKGKKGGTAPEPDKPPEESANAQQDNKTNNIRSISDILRKERGEEEVWRCVLPSGTVVRYRENGESQLLFANGNVSESQLNAAPASEAVESTEEAQVDSKSAKNSKAKDAGKDKAKGGAEKAEKGGKGAGEKSEKGAKGGKGEKVAEVGKGSKSRPTSPSSEPSAGTPPSSPSMPVIPECQWTVTNNKGYFVLQTPAKPPPPVEDAEGDPRAKHDTKEKGKDGNKGAKGLNAGATDAKKDEKGVEKGKAERKDGAKGKAGKGGAKDAESVPEVVPEAVPVEVPAFPPEPPKPTLLELPKKKMVQVTDPESEAFIAVREDLVILMQPVDESYCFVQHADGTQILCQQKEFTLERDKPGQVPVAVEELEQVYCPLHNPRPPPDKIRFKEDVASLAASRQSIGAVGFLASQQEPSPAAQASGPASPATANLDSNRRHSDAVGLRQTTAETATSGLDSIKSSAPVPAPALPAVGSIGPDPPAAVSPAPIADSEQIKKYPFSRRKSTKSIIMEPPVMAIDPTVGRTCPHCQPCWKEVYRPPPIKVEPPPTTTVWYMRKDGLPNIQGKLGEGVAVQFQTFEGQYCASWSQPTQQLTLILPSGVILYTDGKTVWLDNSRGVDQGHPDALLIKKKHRDIAINTNGLYAFDLEEGSLYHTDKDGNGFVTHKGSRVEVLAHGLPVPPPSPPKPPYVPVDFFAIEEMPEVVEDPSVVDPEFAGPLDAKAKGKGQGKAAPRPSQSTGAKDLEKPANPRQSGQKQAGGASSVLDSAKRQSLAFKSANPDVPSPAAAGSTTQPTGAGLEPVGLFTPKLHIPVPPIPPAQMPDDRGSQWGIKGLPAPQHPAAPVPASAPDSQVPGAVAVTRASRSGSVIQPASPEPVVALGGQLDGVPEEGERVPGEGLTYELASNNEVLEMPPPPENPKLLAADVGPPARIFVAHDGGYGFEICSEKIFSKYVQTRANDPLCHIAKEGFYGGEESTTFHTFISVKDLLKDPYAPFVPLQENPLPPPVPVSPLVKTEPLTDKTTKEAKLTVVRRVTKCPWIEVNFEFPVLPRIIAPSKPPTLPCCKDTLVSYRRICEYPEFSLEQLDRVERALGEYEKWKCEVLEKPLVETVDPRTEEEITLEKDISECIRQGLAEQKIFEAQQLGVMDSRYAAELLRRMRNGEAWRIEQMLREERALQAKRKEEFQKYLKRKCHPTLCIHQPDLLQKTGPYRPIRNAILRYWKCEEGLRALLDMLGESVATLSEEEEEDPDQLTMEEIEILVKATKKEAIEVFEEMMRLMEEFRKTELFPQEKEFVPKEPEEPPCCFIEWMVLIEKYHRKNYPTAYEIEAAELERLRREEYLRMAKLECGKLLEDMISETETEYAKLTAYRSPSFHSSEYLRDDFWDELMRLVADPAQPPPPPEVEPTSPESTATEDDPRGLFRRKWDTAPWHLNAVYLSVEEAFRVMSYFNSVYLLRKRNLPRDRPQQFHLMPGHMNFRKVKFMSTSLQVAYILNFHDDMGRFKIRKLEECLKVCYEHGPVAPGMLRKIRVFFKARRVGEYADEIEIVTEFDVFKIPITATVLPPEEEPPDDFAPLEAPPSPIPATVVQPPVSPTQALQPAEPRGPPWTDNLPPPEEECNVVKDLISWIESDTMGEVLIKGHR